MSPAWFANFKSKGDVSLELALQDLELQDSTKSMKRKVGELLEKLAHNAEEELND
jgi:hypothetical protein